MGLELSAIVEDVRMGSAPRSASRRPALVLTLAIRAAYVAPLLVGLRRRARRAARFQPQAPTCWQ